MKGNEKEKKDLKHREAMTNTKKQKEINQQKIDKIKQKKKPKDTKLKQSKSSDKIKQEKEKEIEIEKFKNNNSKENEKNDKHIKKQNKTVKEHNLDDNNTTNTNIKNPNKQKKTNQTVEDESKTALHEKKDKEKEKDNENENENEKEKENQIKSKNQNVKRQSKLRNSGDIYNKFNNIQANKGKRKVYLKKRTIKHRYKRIKSDIFSEEMKTFLKKSKRSESMTIYSKRSFKKKSKTSLKEKQLFEKRASQIPYDHYDYYYTIRSHKETKNSNFLSFQKGEFIKLLEQPSKRYWKGELNGEIGFFSSKLVKYYNKKKIKETKTIHYLANKNFQQDSLLYLSFKKGDEIENVEQIENSKFWIGSFNNKIGFFPKKFATVEERVNIMSYTKEQSLKEYLKKKENNNNNENDNNNNKKINKNNNNNKNNNKKSINNVSPNTNTNTNISINTKKKRKEKKKRKKEKIIVYQGIALVDVNDSNSTSLAFKKDDKIRILQKNTTNAWKGEINGDIGFFDPKNIQEIEPIIETIAIPQDTQIQNSNSNDSGKSINDLDFQNSLYHSTPDSESENSSDDLSSNQSSSNTSDSSSDSMGSSDSDLSSENKQRSKDGKGDEAREKKKKEKKKEKEKERNLQP
ncbi:grb2-related adapter protein [Anaeramoeba flamelloides]|uniref:Grb2-related adapter protein n=1 Tax=Anaeramoeba flamelloides TaxID=1746091 RepID=A0ABQ8YSW2_9EUKA|nr:grb2-related adapter protein [Anaeramoeba flamelloides]